MPLPEFATFLAAELAKHQLTLSHKDGGFILDSNHNHVVSADGKYSSIVFKEDDLSLPVANVEIILNNYKLLSKQRILYPFKCDKKYWVLLEINFIEKTRKMHITSYVSESMPREFLGDIVSHMLSLFKYATLMFDTKEIKQQNDNSSAAGLSEASMLDLLLMRSLYQEPIAGCVSAPKSPRANGRRCSFG